MEQLENLNKAMESRSNSKNGKTLVVFFILICASVGMWGQITPNKKIVPWEIIKSEAINGDKDAQYLVGKIYLEGSDVFFDNAQGKLDTTMLYIGMKKQLKMRMKL